MDPTSSASNNRRLLAALGLLLVAAVVLYRVTDLWVGGSPRYRACAAAMRQVVVVMPWSEAERHIDAAVQAGGERWEPGPEVLAEPDANWGIEPGTVQVTCWHFGSGRVGRFRQWLVAVNPGLSDRVRFCTNFDLRKVDERVAVARSENCAVPER